MKIIFNLFLLIKHFQVKFPKYDYGMSDTIVDFFFLCFCHFIYSSAADIFHFMLG